MLDKIRRKLGRILDALEGDRTVTRQEVDRVLAGMRRELVEARARLREREEEVEDYERRLEALRGRGDVDASALEEVEREVRARRAEVEEHRQVVADLTEQFKDAVARRDVLPVVDRRARASEKLRAAGREELRDLERLADEIEGEAHELEARREVEDALGGGEGDRSGGDDAGARGSEGPGGDERAPGEEAFRDAEAEAMLRELKRRMGMDTEEG